jgi:hypothetical protein
MLDSDVSALNAFQANAGPELPSHEALVVESGHPTSQPAPSGAAPYSDFLRGVVLASPDERTLFDLDNPFQFDLWNFHADEWDQNGTLADVRFDDIPPLSTPQSPTSAPAQNVREMSTDSPEQAVQAAGSRAYSVSVWNWIPTNDDHQSAHQGDLALSPEDSASLHITLRLSPIIMSKKLLSTDRDRVLSLLLARCDRSLIVRVASAFPSHLLMEKLVQTALHFQTLGTIPFLHVATFDPAATQDELLSALVAYGAFLSPVPALQDLCLAMTDILFRYVPEQWGQDNSRTRELQQWQCELALDYKAIPQLLSDADRFYVSSSGWAIIVYAMFWYTYWSIPSDFGNIC